MNVGLLGPGKWPDQAQEAYKEGIVAEPLSERTIDRLFWAQYWRSLLPFGRDLYADLAKSGEAPVRFGDWCVIPGDRLIGLARKFERSAKLLARLHLVRVLRNVFGYICGIVIYDRYGMPWVDIRFTDDQLVFDAPPWADFVDWFNDMVICPEDETATAIERAVAMWPDRDRVAVASVVNAKRAMPCYAPPFERLWLPVHSGTPAPFGLNLLHLAGVARTTSLGAPGENLANGLTKDGLCDYRHRLHLDYVADALVADGRPLHRLLSTVLSDRTIPPATGQNLVALVANRAHLLKDDLAASIEINSNPFAVQIRSATYACREGKFFKRTAKAKEFVPISNFSVRIEGTRSGVPGNPALDLVLSIGSRSTTLSLTELIFRNSKKLWRAIRTAAAANGMESPMMYSVPDRKLLPEIIRGTQIP
jgi:hypothetical protein